MTYKLKIDDRIEQLKRGKEYVYQAGTGHVDLGSFMQILDLHIELLQEIKALALAMDKDDVAHVQEWLKKRLEIFIVED